MSEDNQNSSSNGGKVIIASLGPSEGGLERTDVKESDPLSPIISNSPEEDARGMNHKELQHFIRLINNKSEKYVTNEIFNWVSHLLSAVGFLITTFCLVSHSAYINQPILMTLACAAYGLLQTTMFVSSTLHHAVGLGGFSYNLYIKLKGLDHVSIFFSIAGSYLPIMVIIRPEWLAILLTCIVLADGCCGVVIRIACGMKVKMRAYIIMYVAMGWIGVAMVYFVYVAVGWVPILFLALMGVTYTTGAVLYYKKIPTIKVGVFQSHELWHVFVTVASIIHMVNIFVYIMPFDGWETDGGGGDPV